MHSINKERVNSCNGNMILDFPLSEILFLYRINWQMIQLQVSWYLMCLFFLTGHVLIIATVVFHVVFPSQANVYLSSSNFLAIFVTSNNWRRILWLIIARKSTQFDRNLSTFNLVVYCWEFLIYSKFLLRLQCVY